VTVPGTRMRLQVILPHETIVDRAARKVTAHAVNGSFCLLPRHVDFVTVLVPGVLVFEDADGDEHFVATDDAVLVKCGSDVLVSTSRATAESELGRLRAALEGQLRTLDDREQRARAAVRKLEVSFLRGLMSLEDSSA
jgi:F-type H+-transporting ATPase subunit epsilon